MLTRVLTEVSQIKFCSMKHVYEDTLVFHLLLRQNCRAWDSQGHSQHYVLCPAHQPWSPTRSGSEGRLTVNSSSLPKRKLFLILAAVEIAYINIISNSPTTSSFSFLKKTFHDQKPMPGMCLELGDRRGGDTWPLLHPMNEPYVWNCYHPSTPLWTSFGNLSCLEPKALWKAPLFLKADAGGQTGPGRPG